MCDFFVAVGEISICCIEFNTFAFIGNCMFSLAVCFWHWANNNMPLALTILQTSFDIWKRIVFFCIIFYFLFHSIDWVYVKSELECWFCESQFMMSPISSPLISFLILLPIQRTAINVNHFENPTIFETQFLIKKWEQRNLNRKTLSKEIFHSVSCANLLICTLQCCCIPFDNANVDELIKVKLKRVLIRLMHQNIIYSRVFFPPLVLSMKRSVRVIHSVRRERREIIRKWRKLLFSSPFLPMMLHELCVFCCCCWCNDSKTNHELDCDCIFAIVISGLNSQARFSVIFIKSFWRFCTHAHLLLLGYVLEKKVWLSNRYIESGVSALIT